MPFNVDDRVKNEFDRVLGTVTHVFANGTFAVDWDDGYGTTEREDVHNLVSLATPACECGNPFSLCHPEA